jgi:hypothetical protein
LGLPNSKQNALVGRSECDNAASISVQRQSGVQTSPILEVPFFSSDVFQLDWLHVMDIGVTCDFLGNVLLLLLGHFPQPTQRERIQVFAVGEMRPQL